MTVACFLGTSISQGDGGTGCFPYFTASRLGWTRVMVTHGGIGFLNTAFGVSAKFRDLIPLVTAFHPDIVVVEGGTNDVPNLGFSLAALTAELPLFFAALRAALPNALVYVMAPPCPFVGVRVLSELQANADAIKAACPTWATYIDCGPAKWITGTGDTGAPNGTGNADVYIAPGGHPTNTAGADYIGTRLASAILYGSAPTFASFATEAGELIAVQP